MFGKTIDFKDIISCEITDDLKYIPGSSTIIGGGITIFGIGLGSSRTSQTPGKTIHNYVINIKIDNLKTPIISIVTGNDATKANELMASFEIIQRHTKKQVNTTNRKKTGTTIKKQVKR